MPPEFYNLLVQIPIVGAFVWFVLKWSDRMQAAMDKRDLEFREFLKEQRLEDRKVLSDLVEAFQEHDARMTRAVTTMEERTARREK